MIVPQRPASPAPGNTLRNKLTPGNRPAKYIPSPHRMGLTHLHHSIFSLSSLVALKSGEGGNHATD